MPRRGHGPRLDWRRGTWVIRWTEGGRSRERRTGTSDRGEAEAQLASFLASRRQRPQGPIAPDTALISDLLAAYAEEHGPHIAGRQTLGYNMARLLEWWAGRTVAEITKANCQLYTQHRRTVAVSDNTIRRELSVLSAALGHACESNRLAAKPIVWMPEAGPGKDRWLTRQEAARLLRAARREPQARTHLPLFILLALYGGARKGAILDLCWPQVDMDRSRINWLPEGRKQTKKGRPTIPIPRRLMTFLRLARRRGSESGSVLHDHGRTIGNVKTSFNRAAERAGLHDVTPHTLRHTCGTWMAQAGVPLFEIAGFLGHSIARTTELYAHHSPDYMERARTALDRHSVTHSVTSARGEPDLK